MTKDEELKALLAKGVASWQESQANCTDGFEFERSFDEMWTKLGREVLEAQAAKSKTPSKKKQS